MQLVNPTVFVIDDDDSVRKSLSRLLRSEGMESECYDSAASYLGRDTHDGTACILLDINMPGMSGIELQARLAEQGHDVPIIFLTGHGNVSRSVAAMKRGALDFLTKPVDEADLIRAVRHALDHHRHVREMSKKRDAVMARIDSLTPREREVMQQLITGALNKQIADHLGIATKTVKVHRAHVMEKMSVRSVAELLHLCHMVRIEPGDSFSP